MSTNMKNVMGHPAGLFLLFFTEMWERFSYYGMRALLTLFLVSAVGIGGWEWTPAEALSLYGLYTGLVYITPIFGGIIADKVTGYRNAILLGAFLMTAGHASMAFETEATFYLGLGLLILGNGLFKPNISSIVGGLYEKRQEKKDAAYTIFYMGINAGAFLGIMLCGYIGEKVGWSYGFGLAGVFMFLGMMMFYFGQSIFGELGKKNYTPEHGSNEPAEILEEHDVLDHVDMTKEVSPKVRRDRLVVIGVLAFFTIFFWMAFEQAGGSMTIFAKSFTDRVLEGSAASAFVVVDTIITIVPLAVITWVLILMIRATFKKIPVSGLFIGFSFAIIWAIAIWKVIKDSNTVAYEVNYIANNDEVNFNVISGSDTLVVKAPIAMEAGQTVYFEQDEENEEQLVALEDQGKPGDAKSGLILAQKIESTVIRTDEKIAVGDEINILDVDQEGSFRMLDDKTAEKVEQSLKAQVIEKKDKQIEIPASWFGVLNSLFIILFAPLFSKIWESKYNPSAPIKFAIGLILLGLGFGVLAMGASPIEKGASSAEVSMIWLILAYLLHTLGELALSPVGLSYVSKLSPPKLVGLMFGVWFGATALANYIAGWTGSYIEKISETSGLTSFFLLYTAIPIGAGLILVLLNKWLKQKMHGIK